MLLQHLQVFLNNAESTSLIIVARNPQTSRTGYYVLLRLRGFSSPRTKGVATWNEPINGPVLISYGASVFAHTQLRYSLDENSVSEYVSIVKCLRFQLHMSSHYFGTRTKVS